MLLVLVWQREAIDDRLGHWAHQAPGSVAPAAEHPLAFLRLPSVWLCFSFFFWSTCAIAAMQGFAGPALQRMHGLSVTLAALVITGFMLSGAAGMIAGGFLVARSERLERVIGAALLAAAGALCLAGSGWLPGVASAAVAALAGFGVGLAGPSRDMLIKRASPPGATGRVYGTVYSGLDLGFAIGAPVFGALLDRGSPSLVFFGAALALAMGVLSATLVGQGVARRRVPAGVAVKVAA